MPSPLGCVEPISVGELYSLGQGGHCGRGHSGASPRGRGNDAPQKGGDRSFYHNNSRVSPVDDDDHPLGQVCFKKDHTANHCWHSLSLQQQVHTPSTPTGTPTLLPKITLLENSRSWLSRASITVVIRSTVRVVQVCILVTLVILQFMPQIMTFIWKMFYMSHKQQKSCFCS